MKKIILLLMCLIFLSPLAFAEDSESTNEDLWDNWNGVDTSKNSTAVSDEDFDNALKEFGLKKNKKKKQKGEEFHQSNETEIINHQSKTNLPVLSIPVELKAGEEFLPVGHYQIEAEKDGDNIFINFYQAQYLMAKYPALETSDDYDEDMITFGKWVPEGEKSIKVIFGSMNLNAYTIIDLYEK